MHKSSVIIGSYSHLPPGADESLFEETYQIAWRPFLSVLYRFPDIAATVSYSGTALKWLESRHPEFLMLMEEMAIKKQIELLGGGFFAPLLPLVPGPDRLGQIELLTTYIRKAFGKRPRGCWIQDYAWEPTLASTLQSSGFDFSFLTARHFRLAGIESGDIGNPVMTEDQGRSLVVFPVMDALENYPAVPTPAEALHEARKTKGETPLHSIFYSESAIRSLWAASKMESPDVMFEAAFAALQKLAPDIETTTPSRYLKTLHNFDRAYFPGGASLSLMKKSRERGPALRGAAAAAKDDSPEAGSLRALLLRHEESLALYAKMHYVRILVGQLRGDKSRKKTAQEELWKGQCGDAYWQGPSGGITQLPIRAAAYGALIEAEKTTRLRGSFAPGVISADIDFDGVKEILYQGADLNAYVHLRGGSLTELDSFRSCWNYVNAMSNFKSAPRRLALLDRCMKKGGFGADLGDFAESHYALVETDRPANITTLSHEGWMDVGGRKAALVLKKTFIFRKGSVTVEYELTNPSSAPVALRFAVENNFSAGLSPGAVGLSVFRGRDASVLDSAAGCGASACTSLRLENGRYDERIELRSDRAFELHHEPVFLSSGEGDSAEERYQGCRLWLGWDIDIPAGAAWQSALTLELRA
ncbi:MAG TPA: alpha-amylase/4-alpha-glucanotransferase domain-containing protein [Rectinemataceae bacterium]|nr:alpha-amylase/4-alpha-glucanotransferase domain-containing protein [Rectinemataceae bacterium]